MLAGFDRIVELADDPGRVIPGHDPLVRERFHASGNSGYVWRLDRQKGSRWRRRSQPACLSMRGPPKKQTRSRRDLYPWSGVRRSLGWAEGGCGGATRLHHRGGWFGGLCPGQSTERGCDCPASGGRWPRHLPLDPYSDRLSLLHRQPANRLGLSHRTRAVAGRAAVAVSARPRAGWLFGDQRHALHARAGAPTTITGGNWAIPAGAGTTCCPISGSPRITSMGPATCTARAASGGSRTSACTGTCWTIFATRRCRRGCPQVEDFNTGDNEGVGYFKVNQRAGWRWTTAKAFLRP